MTVSPMLRYFISLFILSTQLIGAQDSIPKIERYGLRVGVDMSKPIRAMVEDGYKGLELTADYRISRNLYVAGEIGTEEKRVTSEVLDFKTSGSYLKVGIDINTYKNWVGMENQILVGFRLGLSAHQQELLGYTISQKNQYWEEPLDVMLASTQTFDGLSGQWIEFLIGVKAELMRNFYMGLSVRMHHLLNDTRPSNFDNLYIPGFNRVSDFGPWGVGLNYTVMYQLPLYKKQVK